MITAPNGEKIAIVVAWYNTSQIERFLSAWNEIEERGDNYIFLQQDENHEGCAKTKNKGVLRAIEAGADIVVILDDDCFPHLDPRATLTSFAIKHWKALQPCRVELFCAVTKPHSRGTPHIKENRSIEMPVAASLGFWNGIPDYDAPSQLIFGEKQMMFDKSPIYGRYFAGCGMNFAFRKEWTDCATLVDIPRFDDIFCFLCWQKVAYEKGFCFNLNGPVVNHSRQSNVFQNLRIESEFLEFNETAWQIIHEQPRGKTAKELREALLQRIEVFRKDKIRNLPKM